MNLFKKLIYGNYSILKFYIKQIPVIYEIINSEIHREEEINSYQPGEKIKITLENSLADNYNKEYKKIQNEFKEIYKEDKMEFSSKVSIFFFLRLVCCALAYSDYFYATLALSLLQFAFLPFSFAISLGVLVQFFPHFICFYAFYPLVTYASRALFAEDSWMNLSLEINENFILVFFLLDLIIC